MRLIYHGVPFPRPAPLQAHLFFLACWNFCAACGLATRRLCGVRSVCMLIDAQLDCGVLPPAGTTLKYCFGLTWTSTTHIVGVACRQFAVFRCVVGRHPRQLCASCLVQLFTRFSPSLAYWVAWLPHVAWSFCLVDWTRITVLVCSLNRAIQGAMSIVYSRSPEVYNPGFHRREEHVLCSVDRNSHLRHDALLEEKCLYVCARACVLMCACSFV